MDDDVIAQRLRAALDAEVPPHDGPSADRVEAIRARALAQRGSSSQSRWLPRLLAASLVLVAFAGGVLVALDPPAGVRDLAHAVGFDVDSSEYVAARQRMDDLGKALTFAMASKVDDGVSAAELTAVADADAAMLAAIGKLDDEDRAELVPTAHQVHLRAVELFVSEDRDLPTAKPSDLEEIDAGS